MKIGLGMCHTYAGARPATPECGFLIGEIHQRLYGTFCSFG